MDLTDIIHNLNMVAETMEDAVAELEDTAAELGGPNASIEDHIKSLKEGSYRLEQIAIELKDAIPNNKEV